MSIVEAGLKEPHFLRDENVHAMENHLSVKPRNCLELTSKCDLSLLAVICDQNSFLERKLKK